MQRHAHADAHKHMLTSQQSAKSHRHLRSSMPLPSVSGLFPYSRTFSVSCFMRVTFSQTSYIKNWCCVYVCVCVCVWGQRIRQGRTCLSVSSAGGFHTLFCLLFPLQPTSASKRKHRKQPTLHVANLWPRMSKTLCPIIRETAIPELIRENLVRFTKFLMTSRDGCQNVLIVGRFYLWVLNNLTLKRSLMLCLTSSKINMWDFFKLCVGSTLWQQNLHNRSFVT